MRAKAKFLGLGLVLGLGGAAILLGGLFLAAMNPADSPPPPAATLSHTPGPTSTSAPPTTTFTFTPTLLVPPTNTPIPTRQVTPTSTPENMVANLLNSGQVFLTGPLTKIQQIQLYAASLNFRRGSTPEARILGESFNGRGYGAPSDICGPLSIAILQEAGLLDKNIDPHDFWLLNPDVPEKRELLKRVFPPERYENRRFKVKLNRFNWRENPLQPGDFVYIYAGTGGNFEHMLVVNRVDSQLRAYAVTNFNTPEGFVINEVLLYDPANPHEGIFQQWTARHFDLLGSTGFDGFELWRLRTP
ncbi:MAG: hypothetical protein Kow002_19290 [Anaerolineales bacterium]